jgi:hypothetical protein
MEAWALPANRNDTKQAVSKDLYIWDLLKESQVGSGKDEAGIPHFKLHTSCFKLY